VVLNLLHGALRVQWVLDRPELVHSWQVWDGFSGVFRSSGQSKRRGSVERDRGSDLSDGVGLGTLEGGLLCRFGFGILGLGRGCKGSVKFHRAS
jgi:hypothetical protein